MPSLVYTDTDGEQATYSFPSDQALVTVGRNPDCSITTTNPSVSRNHTDIALKAGFLVMEDKGSSNGTFLNDEEVKKPVILQEGDRVRCGDFELVYSEEGGEEPKARRSSRRVKREVTEEEAPPKPKPRRVDPVDEAPDDEEPPAKGSRSSRASRRTTSEEPAAQPPPADRSSIRRRPREASRTDLAAADDGKLQELQKQVEELQALVSDHESKGDPDALQADYDRASSELARQNVVNETLNEQQEQLSADLRDQDKHTGELENRLERREMEIENHLEKQKDLREQIAHQSEQVGDLRQETNDRDHEIEDLNFKVDELQKSADEADGVNKELDDEIADFKASVAQKERLIEELQKQADIMTYDLKAAQEQLDQVSETSSGAGQEVNALLRKVSHLQEIITDKEGIIEEQRAAVEERDEELALLKEGGDVDAIAAREKAGYEEKIEELTAEVEDLQAAGRRGASSDKLNELKRANRELRHRVEELEAAGGGDAGGGDAGGGGGGDESRELKGLRRDLAELQEENELLQARISKLSRRQSPQEAADDGAVTALKRENRELRRQLRDLEDQAETGSGGGGGPDQEVAAVLGDVNSTVSGWISDFDSAAFSAAELKRLIEILDRVDLSGLETRDRRKIESIMRDVAPRETLENLEDMLNRCVERAREMKKSLRSVRDSSDG
jgi:pSer/pThr/pTyr-binding forkhead associated (FHA) protein/DNA repair exonuclease SbcCD ATPase subunit